MSWNNETVGPSIHSLHISIMSKVLDCHALDILVHLSWFLFGTDAGGDMQGSKTVYFFETADDLFTLCVWPFCLCHQAHLMVERQLKRCGQFSVLAKRTNVWRAHGTPPKLFNNITTLYDAKTAKKVAGNLPPRPLKGRWGSVWSNELFWKRMGYDMLQNAFEKTFILDKAQKLADKKKKPKPKPSMTEDKHEEEDYGARLGRWEGEAIDDLRDPENWRRTLYSHYAT